MLTGAVTRSQRNGDAPLGPGAGAVGQGFLGDENDGDTFGCQPPRRPKSGDTGTYDDGAGSGHDSNIVGGEAGKRGGKQKNYRCEDTMMHGPTEA
jgi:hypothetical protein